MQQLVSKDFDSIEMHGTTVKVTPNGLYCGLNEFDTMESCTYLLSVRLKCWSVITECGCPDTSNQLSHFYLQKGGIFCDGCNLITFYARFIFFLLPSLTPLANLHRFLICALIFDETPFDWFICIYLSPLFPLRISFLIYVFLTYDHSSRN